MKRLIFTILLYCYLSVLGSTSESDLIHETVTILDNKNYTLPNVTVSEKDFTYRKIISGDCIFESLLIDISEYEYNILIYNLIDFCLKSKTNYTNFDFVNCIFLESYYLIDYIRENTLMKLSSIRLSQLMYKIYDWTLNFLPYNKSFKYENIFHSEIESCLILSKASDLRWINKYIQISLDFNEMQPYIGRHLNFTCVTEQYNTIREVLNYKILSSHILKKIILNNFDINKKLSFFHNPAVLEETIKMDLLNHNTSITILTFYYVTYFRRMFKEYLKLDDNIIGSINDKKALHIINFNPTLYTDDEKIRTINFEGFKIESASDLDSESEIDTNILFNRNKKNDIIDEVISITRGVSKAFSLDLDDDNKIPSIDVKKNSQPKCSSLMGDLSFTKKYSALTGHRDKMTKLYNNLNSLTPFHFFEKKKFSSFLIKTFKLNGLTEFNIMKTFLMKPLNTLLDVTKSPKFLLSEDVQKKYKGTFILNKDNSCLIKISKKTEFKQFLFLVSSLFGGVKLTRVWNDLEKDVHILIDDLYKDMKSGDIEYFSLLKLVEQYHDNKPKINKGGIYGRYLFQKYPLFRVFTMVQEPHIFSLVLNSALEILEDIV